MTRFVPALGGAAVVMIAAAMTFEFSLNQPENAAGPGRPEGIFADVGGWIAFGDRRGIWAVDPTRPGDPDSQVQLSSEEGPPKRGLAMVGSCSFCASRGPMHWR